MLERARDLAAAVEHADRALEAWIGYALPPVPRALAGFTAEPAELACPRCGGSVGEGEVGADGRCGACRGRRPAIAATVRLGPYRDPLRVWIHLVKYAQWAEMGFELGRLLGEAVAARGVVEPARAIVVPVPMPPLRRLHRGIDHAAIIAAGVAAALDAPVARALRRRGGAPQVALGAAARRRRGGRGVTVRRGAARKLSGRDAVLVDDVLTTGATLRRCARRLGRAGPRRVVAAALAAADLRGRTQFPRLTPEAG